MIKQFIVLLLVVGIAGLARANEIYFEGFDDSSDIAISGNASYWGIAPLSGTDIYPSLFLQGGGQSGNIFYGANGYDSTATMTINLPDLTGYTDLRLIISLAAPDGTRWENTHRDSLIISGTSGVIDSFLPYLRGSPLRSQVFLIDLHYYFQDFEYIIDSSIESLTFNFASTAGNEVIGIDSVTITGTQLVPTIDDILEFFVQSVADGSLEGIGRGNSANGKLKALRNMLEAASDLIDIGDIENACLQLKAASKKCDGASPPPDFVKGEAVEELNDMLSDLMAELGCE